MIEINQIFQLPYKSSFLHKDIIGVNNYKYINIKLHNTTTHIDSFTVQL